MEKAKSHRHLEFLIFSRTATREAGIGLRLHLSIASDDKLYTNKRPSVLIFDTVPKDSYFTIKETYIESNEQSCANEIWMSLCRFGSNFNDMDVE